MFVVRILRLLSNCYILCYLFAIEKCPQLDTPTNGMVYITLSNGCKSNAIFKCDPGYILNGSYHLECVDSKWNDLTPTCVESYKKLSI